MASSLSANPHFVGSAPHRSFAQRPLGFIDIGARGGAHPIVWPVADLTAVMCFEADATEFERLQADSRTWPFAASAVIQTAVSDRTGEGTLYLTRNPNNISLLKPAQDFAERFGNHGMDVLATQPVTTRPLDDIVYSDEQRSLPWGEVLKVDTQGADYFVLKGATRTLTERTVAVVCESLMMEMYEGQKLFSDIEALMRDLGFSFYGFIEVNLRSRGLVDKRRMIGRERLFWGDAIFFRDPISSTGRAPVLSLRQEHALFVSALLLGYHDFALELALDRWATGQEADRARDLVQSLAEYGPGQTLEDLRALLRQAEADADNANIHAGRFVDARRSLFDYRDVGRK